MAENHRTRRRLRVAAAAIGVFAGLAGTVALAAPAGAAPSGPQGVDVSHYQGSVAWASVAGSGRTFAYVKATEGNYRVEPAFAAQYNGAYQAGLVRGAYHFARPDRSSGAAQADYFLQHGGGWSADGRTLPGALDMEWGTPFGKPDCYGLSKSAMTSWVRSFNAEYKKKTGRDVVIYTVHTWWSECTGGAAMPDNPAWVAGSKPVVPKGFGQYTFWQYGQGSVAGIGTSDVDVFNGSAAQLKTLARGQGSAPKPAPSSPPATPAPSPSATTSAGAPSGGASASASAPATTTPTAASSSPATGTGAGNGSSTLPVTGVAVGVYSAGGALLLGGGAVFYVLARRRRTT